MAINEPPALAPGSAVPQWLAEILPPFFKEHPAFTEACFAFFKGLHRASYGIFATLYGVASTQGFGDVFGAHSFFVWLHMNLNGLLLGYVFGGGVAGVQARLAAKKAQIAVDAGRPVP